MKSEIWSVFRVVADLLKGVCCAKQDVVQSARLGNYGMYAAFIYAVHVFGSLAGIPESVEILFDEEAANSAEYPEESQKSQVKRRVPLNDWRCCEEQGTLPHVPWKGNQALAVCRQNWVGNLDWEHVDYDGGRLGKYSEQHSKKESQAEVS